MNSIPRKRFHIFSAVLLAALLVGGSKSVQAAPRLFDPGAVTQGMTKNIGPQSGPAVQQASHWARFNVTIQTDKQVYKIGDLMRITINANKNCYIMVYYMNSKGETSVICPSAFSSRRKVVAGKPFRLVDNQGRALKQLGPAGTETVQVVATDKPLDVNSLAKLRHQTAPAVAANPAPKPQKPSPMKQKPNPQKPTTPQQPTTPEIDENSTTVGNTTEVSDGDQFVDDTTKAIRAMVASRSKEISARYKTIGPTTKFGVKDSVYGMASVKYRVR